MEEIGKEDVVSKVSIKGYYESHVTMEPVFEKDLQKAKEIAELYGFRVADLLMQKREMDSPERSRFDTFMTATRGNADEIILVTRGLVRHLQNVGYTVWRYKIEYALLDSRIDDTMGLLST